MVAICVVANTIFPVVVSIGTHPDEPSVLIIKLRQESSEITKVTLSAERSEALRTRHGHDLSALTGRSWRSVLADL